MWFRRGSRPDSELRRLEAEIAELQRTISRLRRGALVIAVLGLGLIVATATWQISVGEHPGQAVVLAVVAAVTTMDALLGVLLSLTRRPK